MEARTDRLVARLAEQELDCLLVTNLLNVRYLTGFTGTNGACIVTPDERLFLTDFRYVEQAAEQVHGYERVELARDMLRDLAGRLRGRAGFEDSDVTVAKHAKLAENLAAGAELVAAGTLVEELREVKDASEVAAMRAAAELADAAYRDMQERGLAGRTEREVAITATRLMVDMGAEEPSFPPIVASGPAGALPHAVPRDVEIASGVLVVVDMGAKLDGYCSDCTRTFATGPLDDGAAEVYDLVLRAQEEALAATRAGAEVSAVDGVARAIIEAAGHGERFGHGLGHGVGLEVHEGPRVAKTATGSLRAGQRRDGRARRLPAGRAGRADRGPRDRHRRRAGRAHGVPQGPRHHGLIVLAATAALVGALVQTATGFGYRAGAEPGAVRGPRPLRGGDHDAPAGAAAERARAARLGARRRAGAPAGPGADRGAARAGAGSAGAVGALEARAPGGGGRSGHGGGGLAASPPRSPHRRAAVPAGVPPRGGPGW